MTFDIQIPTELGDKSLQPFFKGWNWLDDPPSPVVLHFDRGTHIAPWAAALFGAYGIWLKEVREKAVDLDYDPKTYVGKFLERIGLPQLFGSTVANVEVDQQRIFPLTRINESKQIGPTATVL